MWQSKEKDSFFDLQHRYKLVLVIIKAFSIFDQYQWNQQEVRSTKTLSIKKKEENLKKKKKMGQNTF